MLLQVLRSIYHTIWYIVAGLIVIAAVGVTLARLSLPYIDNFRADIQHWLGDYLGHPVEIEKIEADWQGWKPSLYLQQITVLNKSGVGKITDFKSAVVLFDPFYSLLQRDLVPSRVQINSPELTVIRQEDGSISITRESENLPFDNQTTSQTEITRWLLLQRHIAIKDARLTLVNLANQDRTLELSGVTLNFRNIIGRTQIDGSAVLPQRYGDSIDFALDIHGDISTPDWSGELFLKASAVAPSAILDYADIRPEKIAFSSSPVTLKLWSRWKNARVYRVDGTFSVAALQLVNPAGKTHNFNNLAARFAARRNDLNDFSLALETGDLLENNNFIPENSLHIYRERIPATGFSRYTAGFSQLNLQDIVPWLEGIPGMNAEHLLPDRTRLDGNLVNARVIYDPTLQEERQLYIDSDFRDLSVSYDDNEIRKLQGHIRGDLKEGMVDITSSTLGLDLPVYFDNTINFYETAGAISWRYGDGEWEITTEDLSAHTLHFHTDFKGRFTLADNGSNRFTDMGITIRDLELEYIERYLPKTLNSELSEWIDNALTAGEVSSLDILFRGQMDAFPFREKDGRFQVLATINNATLDYNPAWTPVDNLAAELQINQDQLTINASAGNILSADITDANAIITGLGAGKSLLQINGSVNGNLDDAMVFINNSPLAEKPAFREISEHGLQGGFSLDIDLDIPLHAEPPGRIEGDIELFNAALNSNTVGIRLDNINGIVMFTRDGFVSEKLNARYAGRDVQLGVKSKGGEPPVMSLTGTADDTFLAEQFTHFYPELEPIGNEIRSRVSGTTEWIATLSTEQASPGGRDRQLTIRSSLAGLKLDMPAPLGKTEQALPLVLTTPLTTAGSKTIEFNYGDILSGIFELDKTGPGRLRRATLSFGDSAVLPDKPGIVIDGSIEQLSLSEWFNFINTPEVTLDSSLLDEMDFNIVANSLVFFDHTFTDVNFNLFRQQSDWKINLLGNQIKGNISVPESTTGKPLRAKFEKFHITDHEQDDLKTPVKPDDIPPLRISVSDFHYKDINLGELTLNSSRTPTGMAVDEMTFVKPDMTITGKGTWQYVNNTERCEFTFDLHAEYLDAMLQTFNYSVAPIKDGATTLILDASWNGSPGEFSLANMDGTLLMDIEKGQFLDIEPAAGRLFGLLSLQTLPRRLSLDFSDLFSEGLTFDRIEGDFTIQSGNAYTNNLTLKGPSANIDVTGRTGLIDQDYDQLVTVTPQFADSLPVASALFGPIGVGVGAVLFLAGEMFESIPEQIDKLWRYQYTIKGSWDDPVVEKYKDSTKSSG